MLSEMEINKEIDNIEKFVVEIVERMHEHVKEGYRPLTSDVAQLYEYTLQLDSFDWALNGNDIMKSMCK